jgi:sulfopyruvate decarboxylase subunit alpha
MNTSSPPSSAVKLLTGAEMAPALRELDISHVVWLPDSVLGPWEPDLQAIDGLKLVRVCREGEAWVIAGGLYLGGKRPLVIIQSTGMFESGDALRNILFDLGLPLFALVGYRNYLIETSKDTAKTYCEPIARAWGIDSVILTSPNGPQQFVEHFRKCEQAGRPGIGFVAEGKG